MSDSDLFIQIGRMLEAHGECDDPNSNMTVFRKAGLIDYGCDASLITLDTVLRNLAKRLRAGDNIELPIEFPTVIGMD